MRESRAGSGPVRGARSAGRGGRSGAVRGAAGTGQSRQGSRPGGRPDSRPETGGSDRPRSTPLAAPARTTAGAAVRAGSPAALRTAVLAGSGRRRPRRPRRPRTSTARLAAVVVVLGLLLISYASSVRTYLSQRSDIGAAQAGIALRQKEISASQEQLEQWSDPTFLATQARERFALVRPGDQLYLVLGGTAAGSAAGSSTGSVPEVGGQKVTLARSNTWWSRVAGSVGAAGAAPAGGSSGSTGTTGTAGPVAPR